MRRPTLAILPLLLLVGACAPNGASDTSTEVGTASEDDSQGPEDDGASEDGSSSGGDSSSSTGGGFDGEPVELAESCGYYPEQSTCTEICGEQGGSCVRQWGFGVLHSMEIRDCDPEGFDLSAHMLELECGESSANGNGLVGCECAVPSSTAEASHVMSEVFDAVRTSTVDATWDGTCQDWCDVEGLGACAWVQWASGMDAWRVELEALDVVPPAQVVGDERGRYRFGCAL